MAFESPVPIFRQRLGKAGERWVWLTLLALFLASFLAVLLGPPKLSGPAPYRPTLVVRELDGLVSGAGRVAPGATVYVAGPRGVWTGAAGIAQPGRTMRANTRFRLNSVGKLWTATLILKLVEQHKLSLGDSVSHWLPGLLPYGSQINLQELLSMTSGMVDTNDFYDSPRHYIARLTDPALRARMLALANYIKTHPNYQVPTQLWLELAAASPLLYVPGTTWHYSNIGYMVAGLIAARAGGADLATLFNRLIIDPMHLTSARYDPAPNITGSHAHGYGMFPNGRLEDISTLTGGLAANGGIVADAADEARFLQDLMRGRILKYAELQALEMSYSSDGYGLGTGIGVDGCGDNAQVFDHNGAGTGYMSTVQVSPDGRRVAVLLMNGNASTNAGQDRQETAMVAAMRRLYCAN
jgi:D-alanyl-D-alanine carboxypeptidase